VIPLKIIPCDHSHARMGENYKIQVLKKEKALTRTEVRMTYSNIQNLDYPHRLTTDEDGRVKMFLTARGN